MPPRHTYRCSSCPYKAKMPNEIATHMEQMGHGVTTLTCPGCKGSIDKSEICEHALTCFRRRQAQRQRRNDVNHDPCPTCGKVIGSKKAYAKHVMMHLREQGQLEAVGVPYTKGKQILYFFCDKCGKRFTEEHWLQKHIQVSLISKSEKMCS